MITFTVNSVAAGGLDPTALHTFAFQNADKDEPLVEQKLQRFLAADLIAKGLREDAARPDVVAVISHSESPEEEAVPGKVEHFNYYEPDKMVETVRYVRGLPVTTVKDIPGQWKVGSKKEPNTTRIVFFKRIRVSLHGVQASAAGATGTAISETPLWEGNVMNQSPTSDILKVAAPMLRELADEFPRPSGKPETRSVLVHIPAPADLSKTAQ